MADIHGSICLSNIPKELIKEVQCKDGVMRKFLDIKVVERREVGRYGDTHFVSCEPRKEERREGVNYIIGNLKPFSSQPSPQQAQPTQAASLASHDGELPF